LNKIIISLYSFLLKKILKILSENIENKKIILAQLDFKHKTGFN
jgi:hypothetical protein